MNNSPQDLAVGSYFAALSAASAPGVTSTTTKESEVALKESFISSPTLLYIAIGIFFAIFAGGIIFQIVTKVFDWKRTVTALTLAILLASLPFGLRLVMEQTSLQSNAGPDEVPREVRIIPSGKNIIINWQTVAQKTGAIRYSRAPYNPTKSLTLVADSGIQTTAHTLTIKDLTSGIYAFEMLSGSTWYNNGGNPIPFVVQ